MLNIYLNTVFIAPDTMNRNDFPILTEQVYNRPLVYLDNAATTQKPQAMMDALQYAYSHFNANIHRGVHHLSQLATRHHEQARQTVADFLHAASPNEIIFTKGTTDSINMLAFSIGEAFIHEGDEIIISAVEHHSNIVPWQMLCERKGATLKVIPLRDDLSLDMEAYKQLLSDRTRLVAVAHISNVLGTLNPVEDIIRLAHERDIPVLIDGAQSAAHLPIDVQQLDCDFFACSAHKIYGPTGLGVLYGKERWLNLLPPAQGGGEMIEHVTFEHTTYNTLPYKFEAGTPDFIGSYTFAKTLEFIGGTGMAAIAEHEHRLTEYAQAKLKDINGVRIYAESLAKFGVISFNAYTPSGELVHPFDLGMLLDHQGVAVRTGHHCAEPLVDHLGVPGTVRISFAMYNNEEDIDIFITALNRAIDMLSA